MNSPRRWIPRHGQWVLVTLNTTAVLLGVHKARNGSLVGLVQYSPVEGVQLVNAKGENMGNIIPPEDIYSIEPLLDMTDFPPERGYSPGWRPTP